MRIFNRPWWGLLLAALTGAFILWSMSGMPGLLDRPTNTTVQETLTQAEHDASPDADMWFVQQFGEEARDFDNGPFWGKGKTYANRHAWHQRADRSTHLTENMKFVIRSRGVKLGSDTIVTGLKDGATQFNPNAPHDPSAVAFDISGWTKYQEELKKNAHYDLLPPEEKMKVLREKITKLDADKKKMQDELRALGTGNPAPVEFRIRKLSGMEIIVEVTELEGLTRDQIETLFSRAAKELADPNKEVRKRVIMDVTVYYRPFKPLIRKK